MSKLLIIDCYLDEVGAAPNFVALVPGHQTETVRAVFDPIPSKLEDYDGILITGSAASAVEAPPWLEPIEETIRKAAEMDLPILGVCFGHQIIPRALFGPDSVWRSPTSELGWHEIEVHAPNPLFDGVPEHFECFVSHFDEVRWPAHEQLQIFARSERCAVHAYQVRGKRIFGIQFHPEMPLEESKTLVHKNLRKHSYIKSSPDEMIARATKPNGLGTTIFSNFLRVLDS